MKNFLTALTVAIIASLPVAPAEAITPIQFPQGSYCGSVYQTHKASIPGLSVFSIWVKKGQSILLVRQSGNHYYLTGGNVTDSSRWETYSMTAQRDGTHYIVSPTRGSGNDTAQADFTVCAM